MDDPNILSNRAEGGIDPLNYVENKRAEEKERVTRKATY